MFNNSSLALILAAGKGTRMKSDLPKPMVPMWGAPMVRHIVDAFRHADVPNVSLVVGYQSDYVMKKLGDDVSYVIQQDQLGTAHAVLQAKELLNWKAKNLFVFVGDSPLITPETIQVLEERHLTSGAACSFLTADFDLDLPYARVVKDTSGNLIKCVEERDASAEELTIKELLSSHFIFNADLLFEYLPKIKAHPTSGEYYLTDIIGLFLENQLHIEVVKISDYRELVGLNTPEDVAWAEQVYNQHL